VGLSSEDEGLLDGISSGDGEGKILSHEVDSETASIVTRGGDVLDKQDEENEKEEEGGRNEGGRRGMKEGGREGGTSMTPGTGL